MFSSNLIKILFLFSMLGCQACSLWQARSDATPTSTPFVAEELKSEIPFSNKEPESFQTEIVITVDGETEEKIFSAKNGINRLIVFNFQAKHETAILQIGENQRFTIRHEQKIYIENLPGTAGTKSETLNDFLTAELLVQKTDAKFETLGTENDLVKYRVNLDNQQNSEIIIYVDEKIGLPVKQEFYSFAEGTKKLTLTVELKNFSLQVNASFFEVPKNYRKVSQNEFEEIFRRERTK